MTSRRWYDFSRARPRRRILGFRIGAPDKGMVTKMGSPPPESESSFKNVCSLSKTSKTEVLQMPSDIEVNLCQGESTEFFLMFEDFLKKLIFRKMFEF